MTIHEQISVGFIVFACGLIAFFPVAGSVIAPFAFASFGLQQYLAFKRDQMKSLTDLEQADLIAKLQKKTQELEDKVSAILISRSMSR